MFSPRRPLFALLLAAAVFIGSCVGGDDPTGVRTSEVGIALQPALIPSAADASALPVNWIRAIVARQPDGVVLRDQRFEVSPTAASWTLDVAVPVAGESVEVIVYLYLLNVDGAGIETVQFSGRTDPITVEAGARLANVDADVVRGPPTNLLVTSVSITSAPATVYVGETANFAASVTTSAQTTPEIFWTSLDPAVLTMEDSVGAGVAAGTARVVASAGAFADTASVAVVVAAVDSVRVSPDSADVQVGVTRTYTAVLLDVNGNTVVRPVTWTTGNASIATVSTAGVVTGVAAGTTTVRATSEGIFDDAVVRVTAAPTGGGTNDWIAAAGSWSVGSNWSLGRPPAPADTVRITQGTGYTVTLDVPDTIAKLVLGGGITLSMGANSLTMTGPGNGPELDIQPGGTLETTTGMIFAGGILNAGTLRTLGVTTVQADSIRNTGEWRAVTGAQLLGTVTGPWFDTDSLVFIGPSASVTASAGTEMHYRGGVIGGPGYLSFSPGSTLFLHQDLVVTGFLAFQGASIADEDSEDVTITEGAIVQLFSVATDASDISAGTLTVEGALFVSGPLSRVSAPVNVMSNGIIEVITSDGPTVFTTGDIDNQGTIVLGGDEDLTFGPGAGGVIWNREEVGEIETVPFSGTGIATLNGRLQNDGYFLVAGPTALVNEDASGNPVGAQHTNGANASIEIIDGGDLEISLGGTNPRFTNSGSINVQDGATLFVENLSNPAGQIIANAGAVFEGDGAVDLRGGPPTYPALTGVNNGAISPGQFGAGVMTWWGTVPMGPTGTIEIDLDGPQPGTGYDQLNVSAQLVLNGNGSLNINAGYSPFLGDRYAIISYGTRVGNFSAVNLPTISGVLFDTLTVVTASTSVPDTFVVYVAEGPAPAGGVVGDWTFNESTGQATYDVLGQGNHGTLGSVNGVDASDPAWIAGRVGGALRFTGGTPSDFVQVLDNPTLEPTVLTVEAFVRSSGPGTYQYIVSKGAGPGDLDYPSYALYTGVTGGLMFFTSTVGAYISADAGTGVWDGNWHHVAGTFDGSEVVLYVDGLAIGTSVPAAMDYTTLQGDLTIGAYQPSANHGFTGDIDEVRVWSRVLTPSEIAARAQGTIALDAVIGSPGTDADAVDGLGNPVNLVGTASDVGATTLAVAAAGAPTYDFNSMPGGDRTTGFQRADLLAVVADQKHNNATLLLDLDNDGSFADEVAQQGFGLHANRFVTFDLTEIRADAGLASDQSFTLTGVAGPADANPTTGMSFAILADGNPAFLFDVAAGASTSVAFDVPMSGSARFLTFIALEGLALEPNFDHGGFAQVTLSP
jgi:hypothetical protein